MKREKRDNSFERSEKVNESSSSDHVTQKHIPNVEPENDREKKEETKLMKNEKNNFIIFSSLLRYKKYLTKKGNTYFDFNQTNLKLNEKEILFQSSNYFHVFDLRSLFYPHVYVNVNSHMNINISDYLDYVKKSSSVCVTVDSKQNLKCASRQEFILEAIQNVEHIEVFKKVCFVKKLILTLNPKVVKRIEKYVDNIPEINSNDYIFVQTNRKNDILFGYVKNSKFNLIFEVLNFKNFFKKCYDDNVSLITHEVNYKSSKEQSFFKKPIGGETYLKEQVIHVKREVYKRINICSVYYSDYYFFKNSFVEFVWSDSDIFQNEILNERLNGYPNNTTTTPPGKGKEEEEEEEKTKKKQKKILVFTLCLKYIKNNLIIMILYNYNNSSNEEKKCINMDEDIPNLREMDMYNKHFNLNETDKNLFKRNTFFIYNLYDQLKCKLLCLINFKKFPTTAYITSIYLTKLKRCKLVDPKSYSFTIYCLSNEGTVYIFMCNLILRDIFCEETFELHVSKYYHFQLNRKGSYHNIKVIKFSSDYMFSLRSECTVSGELDSHLRGHLSDQLRVESRHTVNQCTHEDVEKKNQIAHIDDRNITNKKGYDNTRKGSCGMYDKWNTGNTVKEEISPFIECDRHGKPSFMNRILYDSTMDDERNNHSTSQMAKYKYIFLLITSKYDFFIIILRRKKNDLKIELVNYSCTNSNKPGNIISSVQVNKHNFEKGSEEKPKGKIHGEHKNQNKNKSKSQSKNQSKNQHRINPDVRYGNRNFTLLELLCYYQNGGVKKYNFVCTTKNQHFEFFLVEKEKSKGEILCKKQFFIPLLFPFNEEVLKKKKKNANDILLYNTEMSYFNSIVYIFYQEKQYENIGLCINNECIIINYVKSISKLFRKMCSHLASWKRGNTSTHTHHNMTYVVGETRDMSNPGRGTSERSDVGEDMNESNKQNKSKSELKNTRVANLQKVDIKVIEHPTTSGVSEDVSPDELSNNRLGRNLNGNLFTQRDHKTHFWEYKYILFGFYDLFLINEKRNNPDENEKDKKRNLKNVMNSYDAHSHFKFINIIKDYVTYDTFFKYMLNLSPKENKKKIKMNFYYFLQILNYFKKCYVNEYNSFFHLIFNEFCQENTPSSFSSSMNRIAFQFYECIDIRNYFFLLFSFFIHMYNYCLKQYGLSNDYFSSHITYFLINKKNRRNRKRFRYIYKISEHDEGLAMSRQENDFKTSQEECKGKNPPEDTDTSMNNTKHLTSLNNNNWEGEESKTFIPKENNENNHMGDHTNKRGPHLENESKDLRMKILTFQKCLYYINKIKIYHKLIFNDGAKSGKSGNSIFPDVYANLYLCQTLYIMLNTLRINNTNVFVNLNYNLRKNNLDYFYLIILLNFYGLFYIMITSYERVAADITLRKDPLEKSHHLLDSEEARNFPPNAFIPDDVCTEKEVYNDGDEGVHKIFEDIFKKDNARETQSIDIDADTFERYHVLIYEFVKRKMDHLKDDHYIFERIFFKINCVLCGKVCLSNLYNHYYICENKHVFNKCMTSFCCIYKNSLLIPSVFISHDLNKQIFEEKISTLQFNLRIKLDYTYFCSFCYFFITTQNKFFNKYFLFNQCPFCNHDLVTM
ncbi:hypothetical protein, conserved [Plasmodium gonderi]|uniref:Uncharacterized protein n=1 Tax=Plasmodium gonderi TaxID=77519 RepID=A0A1Y1JS28_PLAGO|nr:hypothetical protein, conserved [Plasmodium gonderi]GAW83612.1 hypothetical protein, conserved [Plasmodium gonderi]